eukprot:SAG31_NODE_366_length_16817_cov_17.317921_12_plen_251_part_00
MRLRNLKLSVQALESIDKELAGLPKEHSKLVRVFVLNMRPGAGRNSCMIVQPPRSIVARWLTHICTFIIFASLKETTQCLMQLLHDILPIIALYLKKLNQLWKMLQQLQSTQHPSRALPLMSLVCRGHRFPACATVNKLVMSCNSAAAFWHEPWRRAVPVQAMAVGGIHLSTSCTWKMTSLCAVVALQQSCLDYWHLELWHQAGQQFGSPMDFLELYAFRSNLTFCCAVQLCANTSSLFVLRFSHNGLRI